MTGRGREGARSEEEIMGYGTVLSPLQTAIVPNQYVGREPGGAQLKEEACGFSLVLWGSL